MAKEPRRQTAEGAWKPLVQKLPVNQLIGNGGKGRSTSKMGARTVKVANGGAQKPYCILLVNALTGKRRQMKAREFIGGVTDMESPEDSEGGMAWKRIRSMDD
ncbi:hypothetical protein Nepgr_015491 [Nepenthes gracilis]|uniref:Uncharacterized protein n=1 Tax=Nepenthes gracilis TaxID=150966 RepID=A0AAD3XRL0_NEPGR|nr:hypothetical protein Nepgr_015491 [Nepenthes gracilis]